jgi:hypothetical protein
MWFFRSFSQKNEKNNRAPMVSVKLISVALRVCPEASAKVVAFFIMVQYDLISEAFSKLQFWESNLKKFAVLQG